MNHVQVYARPDRTQVANHRSYASEDVHKVWLEKWAPADCCPSLQEQDGWAVAMLLARHASADVQQVWLKKWPPADCCPWQRLKDRTTVVTLLADYASPDVASLWKRRWLAALSSRSKVAGPQ